MSETLPITENFLSSNTDSYTTSSSSSIFSFFQSITWTTWFLFFLVLAFLGFNIFTYIMKGTQETVTIFTPIINWFLQLFGNTTKQVIDVSAKGITTGVDVVADTTTGVIDVVQNAGNHLEAQNSQPTGKDAKTTQPSAPIQNTQPIHTPENSLNQALNNPSNIKDQPASDDSYSSIQMSKQSSKSGWCYIGEDRGFRSCIELGVNDQCMSGDIFPSQNICVNPNLRT